MDNGFADGVSSLGQCRIRHALASRTEPPPPGKPDLNPAGRAGRRYRPGGGLRRGMTPEAGSRASRRRIKGWTSVSTKE
jgi:hypothetical protein